MQYYNKQQEVVFCKLCLANSETFSFSTIKYIG